MNYQEQTRRRIQNMAVYLVGGTKCVDPGKLYKLFYAADKLAIERTAFSISDLPYYAALTGPMPLSIEKDKGIIPTFSLNDVLTENEDGTFKVADGVTFSKADFTDAELAVLSVICEAFCDVSGEAMSEQSHAEGEPWRVFIDEGNKIGARMPLEELIERDLPATEREGRCRFRADARASQDMFRSLVDVEMH